MDRNYKSGPVQVEAPAPVTLESCLGHLNQLTANAEMQVAEMRAIHNRISGEDDAAEKHSPGIKQFSGLLQEFNERNEELNQHLNSISYWNQRIRSLISSNVESIARKVSKNSVG